MDNELVKELCFISHQGNAISKVKSTGKPNACEDSKQHKMSNVTNGNRTRYTYFGEEFVSFS